MLKANEVKITITVVNRSFNKITFGPLLVGEVVKTISIPTMAKAMDAQTNTFVVIFCIVLVYQLKHFFKNYPIWLWGVIGCSNLFEQKLKLFIFKINIMLLGRKLIAIAFEGISKNTGGKTCIRTITFPVEERAGLNKVKMYVPLFNIGVY